MNKKIVPWYSMSEWNDVYEKIYSNDFSLQNQAYDKMCKWKIRCPKLPVGVESTMEILHIQLLKQKLDKMYLTEKDVQLMCSTTLMRFVNYLTHLYTNQTNRNHTCKDIGEMCKIPEWIIGIRHQTAHSHQLASTELLTNAIDFVLQWLHDNYWRVEAKDSEDFVVDLQIVNTQGKINMLLNLWQACSLYKFASYKYIEKIPNNELRTHLAKLSNHYKQTLAEEKKLVFINDIFFKTTLDEYLCMNVESDAANYEVATNDALKYLIEYMDSLCFVDHRDTFVECLLQCELFLPTNLTHCVHSDGNILNGNLCTMWEDVLNLFDRRHALPTLFWRIAEISIKDESESRKLVAACWLSILIEVLRNDNKHVHVITAKKNLKENNRFAKAYLTGSKETCTVPDSVMHFKEFVSSNRILVDSHTIESIVKLVTGCPNIHTNKFLPSLLTLVDPPMDRSAQDSIIQLVKIYTDPDAQDMDTTSDTIYTAEMLAVDQVVPSTALSNNSNDNTTFMDTDLDCKPVQVKSKESSSVSVEWRSAAWSKQSGVYKWSSIPFGAINPTPFNVEET